MERTQIAILVNLAAKDGEIDQTERDLILRICEAHGFSQEQAEEFFKEKDTPIDFSALSVDQRFDTLHNLVQLMKVDGKIFDEEISYCMQMAKKLGYPMEAVMDLYGFVHANVKLHKEIQRIKRKYHQT
jgi:uncharacterized membrane protein YebE (DUF533 family)